jgi:DNA-binding NarL/FixJ family response regulator
VPAKSQSIETLRALLAIGTAAARSDLSAGLTERGFSIVADVGDASSALAAARRECPAVCLVDLELPGGGLTAVQSIATRVPATTVVALAASESASEMLAALERGAAGYLVLGLGLDELAKTLRAAHAGEPALSRALVSHLIEHMRHKPLRLVEMDGSMLSLTPREWDMVEPVREGLSTESIARRLGLSPVTVRRHISSLARKTGSPDRAGLAERLRRLQR